MFPHKIEECQVEEKYQKWFGDAVHVGPKKYTLMKSYKHLKEHFYNFQIRPDDVWICGFARAGTTMTEEIAWLICNDLNFEAAKSKKLDERVPFFEFILTSSRRFNYLEVPNRDEIIDTYFQRLNKIEGRRFLKTHIPFSLMSENILNSDCKIIYVARNPKDIMVSTFNFFDLVFSEGYGISFEEHFDLFTKNFVTYSPYLEHLKEAWELRNKDNFLFLFYEEILKDKVGATKKIADFFGKKLTEKGIEDLMDYMKIENFKKNKAVNHSDLKGLNKNREQDFIRKGEVGGWRNYFSEELSRKADEWIEKGLKESDLLETAKQHWE